MDYHLVLAGGHSTRLPNKLFLTTLNGAPVFCSVLDLLIGRSNTEIVIACIEKDERFIRGILQQRYGNRQWWNVRFLCDEEPTGLMSVLQRAAREAKNLKADTFSVFCGDNIYPADWLCRSEFSILNTFSSPSSNPVVATVARTVSINDPSQLDGYCDKLQRWVPRHLHKDFVLLTPWMFGASAFDKILASQAPSVVGLLNDVGALPWYATDPTGWYDLGTMDSWEQYKRGK